MEGLIDELFKNANNPGVRSLINSMHEYATVELAKELSSGEEKYDNDVVVVSLSTQINEEYSFTFLRAMALDMYRDDAEKRTIINEFLDSLQKLYNQSEEIVKRC